MGELSPLSPCPLTTPQSRHPSTGVTYHTDEPPVPYFEPVLNDAFYFVASGQLAPVTRPANEPRDGRSMSSFVRPPLPPFGRQPREDSIYHGAPMCILVSLSLLGVSLLCLLPHLVRVPARGQLRLRGEREGKKREGRGSVRKRREIDQYEDGRTKTRISFLRE